MKNLNLTYSDEDFQKLKNSKEKLNNKSKERVTWEEFVFKNCCGK